MKLLKIDEYWFGYLAGMIDADGSVQLVRAKYKNRRGGTSIRYDMRISISNNCREVLELLKSKFGGFIYEHGKGYRRGRAFRLVFPPSITRKLLPKLRLTVKEGQRKLLLEASEYVRMWGGRGRPVWADNKLEQICNEIIELNKRYKL